LPLKTNKPTIPDSTGGTSALAGSTAITHSFEVYSNIDLLYNEINQLLFLTGEIYAGRTS
jgi:hypothetical protein